VIEFPLRGVWISPNNSRIKIPSHGTHLFGETYAFDFVKVDENSSSNKFYKTNLLDYLL